MNSNHFISKVGQSLSIFIKKLSYSRMLSSQYTISTNYKLLYMLSHLVLLAGTTLNQEPHDPQRVEQNRVEHQCWTWSRFRIAIQPDSAIQNQIPIGLDFEIHSTGADMDNGYPNCIDHCNKMLNQSFFRISTGLDQIFGQVYRITQWKFWTGVGLKNLQFVQR